MSKLQDGTPTPTIDTRTQLGTTVTTDSVVCLCIDFSNLVADEFVEVEPEMQFESGGAWVRVDGGGTFGGDESEPGKVSLAFPVGFGLRFFVKQTNGTARQLPFYIYGL